VRDFLIYALYDPTIGSIRYIGQSCNGMLRPKSHRHKSSSSQPHLKNWVRSLEAKGIEYGIMVVQRCSSQEELNIAEINWIRAMRVAGCDLINKSSGGFGMSGFTHSESAKAKMRLTALAQGRKGKPQKHPKTVPLLSEALRNSERNKIALAKAHAARRGVPPSPQCIERITLIGKRPKTAEHRMRISQGLTGVAKSPEHVRKSVESKRRNRILRQMQDK